MNPQILNQLDLSDSSAELLQDPNFVETRAAYERALSALHCPQVGPLPKEALTALRDLRAEFQDYCRAKALVARQVVKRQIIRAMPERNVHGWIYQGKQPCSIRKYDPQGMTRSKSFTLPEGLCIGASRVLGAFVNTTRSGRRTDRLAITLHDPEAAQLLVDSLGADLGVEVKASEAIKAASPTFSVVLPQSLSKYFRKQTADLSSLDWSLLLTQEERLAFLELFFACGRNVVNEKNRNIKIQRSGSLNLLNEVSIVLMREGVVSVIDDKTGTLYIRDQLDLKKLRELNVFIDKERRAALDRICDQPRGSPLMTVQEYEAISQVIARFKREGDQVNPRALMAALRDEVDGFHYQISSIRPLVEGKKPKSVQRLENLEAFESELFQGAKVHQIGQELYQRMAVHDYSVGGVVRDIADWHGNLRSFSKNTGIPQSRARAYFEGSSIPDTDDYKAILGSVGLLFRALIEEGYDLPTTEKMMQWVKTDRERDLFYSFRRKITASVVRSFYEGKSPRQAFRSRITRLARRSA